ncbi:MAG: beta-lactamase domain protein [Candidatus Doudnabacteria bacterium]|nr:beta-lactamase domain protein [Candidatus Doudnabacteria bacterium]
MNITFFGAAQNVTGSKHLIESNGFRVLLDCGLYQGKRDVSNQLNRKLPFDPASIDAVILSHAHTDHCGMLPILVRDGFKGKIYCTTATMDIAKFILLDSAAVQAQDFLYRTEHAPENQEVFPPFYTKEDVERALSFFEPVPYFRLTEKWQQLNENIRFKFYDAGHILGSAITYLEIKEAGVVKGIGFTGDIGKSGAPILHDPELIEENVDYFISEATYGGREHKPLSVATEQLKALVVEAEKNSSKIIVPAFALGRVQELVYLLHDLTDKGDIPRIPMYVDSPLALNISEVFLKHSEDFNQESWKEFGSRHEQILRFRNLNYIHSIEESKALNTKIGSLMIIASSGMMEGGRILHHLKNNISDSRNTILITGYQAEHTLGRKIQDGITPVRIFDRYYDVKAKVLTIDEFSAHADQPFLLEYIRKLKGLKKLFLVHSELDQSEAFKTIMHQAEPGVSVEIPVLSEKFDLLSS